ncbi:MAG: ACP phosphodiesterase [Spongiibacteraceae bacterium]
MGALLGDYVKGPLRGELPQGWEEGIRLHRKIDAISDRHPLRAQLAAALPPEWRRYAGIVLDVCCDHWLSRQWESWHAQPLPQFATQVYRVLQRHHDALPGSSQRFAQRLCDYDMLNAYHDWDAVPATLQRIGTRLRHANPLLTASGELGAAAKPLGDAFHDFYRELQDELAAQGFAINPRPVNAAR